VTILNRSILRKNLRCRKKKIEFCRVSFPERENGFIFYPVSRFGKKKSKSLMQSPHKAYEFEDLFKFRHKKLLIIVFV
jgi:hypothetical protein